MILPTGELDAGSLLGGVFASWEDELAVIVDRAMILGAAVMALWFAWKLVRWLVDSFGGGSGGGGWYEAYGPHGPDCDCGFSVCENNRQGAREEREFHERGW